MMHETKGQQPIFNQKCIEALEEHASKLSKSLDKVKTIVAKLGVALNANGEENWRAMEATLEVMH